MMILRCTVTWLVVITGCASPRPTAAPAADSRWAALDRDVPTLLADNHVPSVSLARIEHGEVVWAAAYGMQSAGVPATVDTLYNIASLTKPVSAEVVLRLAARGTLRLDEPMSAYWVDPDIAGDDRHHLLTPRLALSHRTGFPNWRRETHGVLAFVHDPGEVFGYSGEGFEYLARFVEHKTGTAFESLAQQLVLGPSGMTTTAYTRRPWFDGRVAVPADADGKPLSPEMTTNLFASDLIYTTPRDYARFLLGVIAGDRLTPTLVAERAHVQTDLMAKTCKPAIAPLCPDAVGIGLAWQVFQFADQTLLMHTGADRGLFTFAYVNLASRSATVIFTSGDRGGELIVPILERIGADPGFVALLRKM